MYKFYPLRVSGFNRKERKSTVDLLLLSDYDGNRHYCLIKDKGKLLSKANEKPKKYCDYCHQKFGNKKLLKEQVEYCKEYECVKTFFLKKDGKNILKFKNYEKIHDVPFVIYADFECSLKPIDEDIGENTHQFQKHEPSGYCYLIKCFDDSLYPPKLVRYTKKSDEEDVSLKFDESLENSIREIHGEFKFSKKKIFGEKGKEDFEKAENCYACSGKFEKQYKVKYEKCKDKVEITNKSNKVADHCHYTGKYHGAACISCNLKMRKPIFIPVIFHNLQNYDSHLFIKALGVTEGKLSCIPNNKEKYISFMKEIVVDQYESKEETVTQTEILKILEEDITECEELEEDSEKKYKIKKMICQKTN